MDKLIWDYMEHFGVFCPMPPLTAIVMLQYFGGNVQIPQNWLYAKTRDGGDKKHSHFKGAPHWKATDLSTKSHSYTKTSNSPAQIHLVWVLLRKNWYVWICPLSDVIWWTYHAFRKSE